MRALPLLMLLAVALTSPLAAEPVRVFVSVLPLQTFVAKVGGAHVDVRLMVRPGFSPHTYDPTPQQIAALGATALFVRTGVPFEDAWMDRIRSANPSMQILDVRQGLSLRRSDGHGHEHGHEHAEEQDPHVWTSPRRVIEMLGPIREALATLDPAHADDFAANQAAFTAELTELDREIQALLDPLTERRFMVFHPAWGYFADSYGLEQVPIEREGKHPGAQSLVHLIEQAKREGVRAVFVQPQFDRRQAEQVARAIGGRVISVDPLAADYVDNLRAVAGELAEALRE